MTHIKVFKANGKIVGYELSGHSGYAESGQDIVCASLSTLAGSCHLGLQKVLGLKVETKMLEKEGFFSLKLLENNEKAQVLLETLQQSFSELALEHKKFIKLEIIGG